MKKRLLMIMYLKVVNYWKASFKQLKRYFLKLTLQQTALNNQRRREKLTKAILKSFII